MYAPNNKPVCDNREGRKYSGEKLSAELGNKNYQQRNKEVYPPEMRPVEGGEKRRDMMWSSE
jgi:hypothetical protein